MLFVPGTKPAFIENARALHPDCVILDLEGDLPVSEKDSARILVRTALRNLDFGSIEVIVRINTLETGLFLKDLQAVVPQKPDAVRVPFIRSAEDVRKVSSAIAKIESRLKMPRNGIRLHVMIENAQAASSAFEISLASSRTDVLALGGQDYAANLRLTRTRKGEELASVRNQMVQAARCANLDAIDTLYPDFKDIEGLIEDTRYSKAVGFDGRIVINPIQIKHVHQVYKPTEQELAAARRLVTNAKLETVEGDKVWTFEGRMIDPALINHAKRTILWTGE